MEIRSERESAPTESSLPQTSLCTLEAGHQEGGRPCDKGIPDVHIWILLRAPVLAKSEQRRGSYRTGCLGVLAKVGAEMESWDILPSPNQIGSFTKTGQQPVKLGRKKTEAEAAGGGGN